MVYTFRGGIHPGPHSDPGYKAATNTKPIELLPAPDQVILPVSMHIGAPASPCVKVGDIVDMGQTVAEAGPCPCDRFRQGRGRRAASPSQRQQGPFRRD